ncbi:MULTISPECIES: hypothetical protein [unclassified Streptomyces]|uniref:hypothetical protein n=1 Tax=unclassified Streptomyces TaxID=2593676 RepID=UPI0008DE5B99|nr:MULTISPECIES: hypothetical protein [unclassified Streptomyces]OII61272.1 hypothetical protein BJP39_10715 [Streptomyces sp. CC77]
MTTHDAHDSTSPRTDTEERLVRALAARAGQVTHHSLRPAAPPVPNWAARGRMPLVFALAAAAASVALLSTAVVSLLSGTDRGHVAGDPTPGISTPPSPTRSPSPSAAPSTRAATPPSTSVSPGSPLPPPPSDESPSAPPASRAVTLVYGLAGDTTVLRTGGGFTTFRVTVDNVMGEDVDATDIMTIKPANGTLRPGDVNVSLRASDGTWGPLGSTTPTGHEARLSGADGTPLKADAEHTYEVRVSLGPNFPDAVTTLHMAVSSDAGGETVTVA